RAPRRTASERWTSVAATKRTGAPATPKASCEVRFPVLRPSHSGCQTTVTNATAAVKGTSRTTMSGAIHAQLSGIRVMTSVVVGLVAAIELEVFYDYNCPFVYRAATMLA